MTTGKENGDSVVSPVADADGWVASDAKGLTKREHFAGLALQGMLASSECGSFESFAVASVGFADALLDALAEQGEI